MIAKVTPRDKVSAAKLNELIDAVNALSNLSVGGGLSLRKTGSGVNIALATRPVAETKGTTSEPSGDTLTLGSVQGTQDTDTYDKEVDTETFVEMNVITDIQYDVSTMVLAYRTRTLVAQAVTVSAESDLITITTAEVCEE